MKNQHQIFVAIDPGLKGAIALWNNTEISAKPLPARGKDVDLVTFSAWIGAVQPRLTVVEKVASMPGQGISSTFKFGKGYGALLCICTSLQISVELVTP